MPTTPAISLLKPVPLPLVLSNDYPVGLIALEGMHFYAHHGFYKEEQVIGGQYKVDVYLTSDFGEAATADDLAKTINYEKVYRIVRGIMADKHKLIEHVAHRILEELLNDYKQVRHIKVRVAKINPPVKGTVEQVFVELEEPNGSIGR